MGRADTPDRQNHGPGQPGRLRSRGPVARALTGPGLGAVVVVVVVLAGALVVRGLAAGPGSTPGPSPAASPSAGPSPSAAASPFATEPPPSPEVTPLPSVVITGELPGPEATIPAWAEVMPVGIEAFAATAAAVGLVCETTTRETGWAVGDYGLVCRGSDPAAHAEVWVQTSFWTIDGLWLVRADVDSDAVGGSVTDPTLPARIVLPFAALLGGEAAREWALDKLADQSCPPGGCGRTFAGVLILVEAGSRGGASFHASMAGQAFGGG